MLKVLLLLAVATSCCFGVDFANVVAPSFVKEMGVVAGVIFTILNLVANAVIDAAGAVVAIMVLMWIPLLVFLLELMTLVPMLLMKLL